MKAGMRVPLEPTKMHKAECEYCHRVLSARSTDAIIDAAWEHESHCRGRIIRSLAETSK